MPTLTWIGKDKVVTHHKDVPYRVLTHKYGFNRDNSDSKLKIELGSYWQNKAGEKPIGRCLLRSGSHKT